MMTLIIGGSGSGKSSFAENHIMKLSKNNKMYYLATMKVLDKEGQKKIERHRNLRCGKGFTTIEQPLTVHKALEQMDSEKKCALLECISNLVANEMFSGEAPKSYDVVANGIISNIKVLKDNLEHFVIVSNNVFEDGITYDATTMEYIKALGSVNEKLAMMSDEVIEVVVGIPVMIKEGK